LQGLLQEQAPVRITITSRGFDFLIFLVSFSQGDKHRHGRGMPEKGDCLERNAARNAACGNQTKDAAEKNQREENISEATA
jgi:hypothetical protein